MARWNAKRGYEWSDQAPVAATEPEHPKKLAGATAGMRCNVEAPEKRRSTDEERKNLLIHICWTTCWPRYYSIEAEWLYDAATSEGSDKS